MQLNKIVPPECEQLSCNSTIPLTTSIFGSCLCGDFLGFPKKLLNEMERWLGQVAVVTGASAGIGACLAKKLTENGLKVVGLARRTDRIKELSNELQQRNASGQLYALKCDLSKEEDILQAFKWITDNIGIVHILINNAGLTLPTTLVDGDTDQWRQVFDTNVLGLCICTREAVKIMRANDVAGHVIHINSVVGHYVPNMPEPTFNVYPASKFAVTALTESLRQELRYHKTQIKVTSISPGLVRTEFQENLPDDGSKEMLLQMPGLKPQDVAEAVLYVLSTPPHVQVHELTIRPLGEMF